MRLIFKGEYLTPASHSSNLWIMRSLNVFLFTLRLLLRSVIVYNISRILPKHRRTKLRYREMIKGAKRLAKFFESKKGIFLKAAQYLSSVSNLFAADFSEIFSQVPDRQFKQSYPEIRTRIEQEFSKPIKELFQSFDSEPVAAASFGQVHRARLFDGQNVAVKILHKNMEIILQKDLQTMRRVIWLIRIVYRTLDFRSHLIEFSHMARLEIDYFNEVENLRRVYHNFREENRIKIPKIIEGYCKQTVFCTEYIEGYSLQNLFQKKELKLTDFSARGRKKIIDDLLYTYKKMIFDHKFYHADPHPGNILLTEIKRDDQQKVISFRVAFIDFGASLDLNSHTLNRLRDIIDLLQNHDMAGLVYFGISNGILRDWIDTEKYINLLELIHARFAAFRFDDYQRINPLRFGQIIRVHDLEIVDLRLRDLLVEIRMPRKYIYLARTISLLFLNARNIDNRINMLSLANPHVQDLMKRSLKLHYLLNKKHLWRGMRKIEQILFDPSVRALSNATQYTFDKKLDFYQPRKRQRDGKYFYLSSLILSSGVNVFFYQAYGWHIYFIWSLVVSGGLVSSWLKSRRN